jgi:tetrahydromethanopterin S-methyltransferase subunit G
MATSKVVVDAIEWINGDGTKTNPGAKTRLAIVEDRQDLLEKNLEKMNSNISKAVGWIVGGSITVIAGILIWFFTTLLPMLLKEL